jgi:ornithine carbamoyltransferase
MPNFIDLKDLSKDQLLDLISLSLKWKKEPCPNFMNNKHVVLIFEKPSLRTRVSFEIGINQLGGKSYILNEKEMQLGERETIEDTARVLERYADLIVIRCFGHNQLIKYAETSSIPVINALTDFSHPCQVIADLITIKENLGNFENQKVGWFGDCNNVLQSWIEASALLNIRLYIACPEGINPDKETLAWAQDRNKNIIVTHDPLEAAHGANCIITDTWNSMGETDPLPEEKFIPFQVNEKIIKLADKDVIFMHCLPAYRNKEVTSEVIESANSVIFDEAENRLHAQKAIMQFCFN